MAHVLVYLQRTPLGLHPGSAVAACMARELASKRGASVLGICPGLSDPWDPAMERAAGRFGCDRLLFVGATEARELVRRLRPVHLLVPWTTEGLGAAIGTGLGEPMGRIVDGPGVGHGPLDTVTAVAAGTHPWIDLETRLEGEYTADAGMVRLPEWLATPPEGAPEAFVPLSGPPVEAVVHGHSSPDLDAALGALGARPVAADGVGSSPEGTLLWIELDREVPLPDLDTRGARTSVVVVSPHVGPHGRDDLRFADWVFRGDPVERLRTLARPPWTTPTTG
ncbi:MAG: hypothetical protein D6705_14550 [Deltaproteobacteria bacterium]|nr:MAG: hypothetical protein D6705_14550 [Deltaproteobacteria bacterium]